MEIIVTKYDNDITILAIQGAIDGSSAPHLRQAIIDACEDNPMLLLDMHDVHFMSSAGLRVMLLLHRQLQELDGEVVLVGLREPIYDAMEATGFLKYFQTAPTIETGAKLLGV